jgi:flagellar hook-length control protein FliK
MLADAAGSGADPAAGQTAAPGEAAGLGQGATPGAPGTPSLSDANWAMQAAALDEAVSGAASSSGDTAVSSLDLTDSQTGTQSANPSLLPSPAVSAAAIQAILQSQAAAKDQEEASVEAGGSPEETADGSGPVVLAQTAQATADVRGSAARLASDAMSDQLESNNPVSSTGRPPSAAVAPDVSATKASPDAGAHPVLDSQSTSFETALSTSTALDVSGSRPDALMRADAFLIERSGPTAAGIATGQPSGQAAPGVPIAQVPVEIGLRSLSGANRFDIRLSPDDLGRIDVRLDIALDGTVKAQLVVERPETLAFLQRDAGHLERALEQAGLKPGEGGVAITLRDPAGEGTGHRREQHDAAERGRGQAAAREAAERDEQTTPLRSYGWTRASGVDVRI